MVAAPSLRALSLALVACCTCLAILAQPASAAPDPLSDADGDGLPHQWETPQPVVVPQDMGTATQPKRCGSKQRLRKGHCVRKCKKGQRLTKRGKCVKKSGKKKRQTKARGPRATAQALSPPANVASLGADPDHKDIFVQIDYATAALRQNLACGELDAIVAAFAAAPVSNPDGRTGIDLHIDAGVNCPSRSYDLGGSRVFNANCPSAGATFQSAQLPENRIGTFHIAAFAPTCGQGGSASGLADLGGAKMAVFTDGFSFAHVLMHELGHNLGLDHPFPGQPNRISSMNTLLSVSDSGNGSTQILDYQRIGLPALDENNLSEAAGISAPADAHRFYIQHHCENTAPPSFRNAWPGDAPIDWNCSEPAIKLPPFTFVPDPVPFAADVNGDGKLSVFPATGNEWVTLDYASGGKIGL